jgi:protein-tyrosine-phosphatase
MLSDDRAVDIFKALADPHRVRLLDLLLTSDRTNSELMIETGLSQNLLSHHLNVLTNARLIAVQQSIADARRRYYCPNLPTLRQLGDWWEKRNPACPPPLSSFKRPRRVLFLCLRNAARSLMAEALARHLAPGALIAYSAGMERGEVHPELALRVLEEHGVSTEGLTIKLYDELSEIKFDHLVTVCDRVHENSLPTPFAQAIYTHWSLRDPMDEAEDEAGQLVATRRLYEDLEQRISFFVQRLAAQEAGT